MPPGGGPKSFIDKGLRHLPQTNSHFPFDKPIPAWYNTRMKYSKRSYIILKDGSRYYEVDKEYVLNNLELAVYLLNVHRDFLNKYGPTLKEIEGE